VWMQAQACTGKTGDFDRLLFRVVPGNTWKCDDGGGCLGHFDKPHTITLAHDWITTEWLVRHEMIHDLVGPHPADTAKNRAIWGTACKATWGFLESDDPNYKP
jgi:hypothetical protein